MTKIRGVVCAIACVVMSLHASTRNDVLVLEASESLKMVAQEIAHTYLLSMYYPSSYKYKKLLEEDINSLNNDVQQISINTNSDKAKGVLLYFANKKAEMIQIINNNKKNRSQANEIVLISDLFYEGAESIYKLHAYKFSKEEKMQKICRDMQVALGAILKYDILIKEGISNNIFTKKMDMQLLIFDNGLKKLSTYPYPDNIEYNTLGQLKLSWYSVDYYIKMNKINIPALLSIEGSKIQHLLKSLSIYHAKNNEGKL